MEIHSLGHLNDTPQRRPENCNRKNALSVDPGFGTEQNPNPKNLKGSEPLLKMTRALTSKMGTRKSMLFPMALFLATTFPKIAKNAIFLLNFHQKV